MESKCSGCNGMGFFYRGDDIVLCDRCQQPTPPGADALTKILWGAIEGRNLEALTALLPVTRGPR